MNPAKRIEVLLDEARFGAPADVHAYLAATLRFPAYYGRNLDALNDCLGDLDRPTCVTVRRPPAPVPAADPSFSAWFDRLMRVLERCASENPCLEVHHLERVELVR